jgi:hypothetical protein
MYVYVLGRYLPLVLLMMDMQNLIMASFSHHPEVHKLVVAFLYLSDSSVLSQFIFTMSPFSAECERKAYVINKVTTLPK